MKTYKIIYFYQPFSAYIQEATINSVNHSIVLENIPTSREELSNLLKNDGAHYENASLRYYDKETSTYQYLTVKTDLKKLFEDKNEVKLLLIPACTEECKAKNAELIRKYNSLEAKVSNVEASHIFNKNASNNFVIKTHLAIMYAEPLAAPAKSEIELCDYLNYSKECQKILDTLEAKGKKFLIQTGIATSDTLSEIIGEGPIIIHVACQVEIVKEKPCLFLEDNKGNLQLISSQHIQKMTKKSIQTKLVVVASNDPENAVKIFYEAKFPCVLGVKLRTESGTEFVRDFTKAFYDCIFDGQSIEEAISNAKNWQYGGKELIFSKGVKFDGQPLIPTTEKGKLFDQKENSHEIQTFKGKFQLNKLIGLNKEVHALFSAVCQKDHQVTFVVGAAGSGKSVLVRQFANYAYSRGCFREMISTIDLSRAKLMESDGHAFLSELVCCFPKSIKTETTIDTLTENLKIVKNKPMLVILENCDAFWEKNSEIFRKALETVGSDLTLTKFVITTNNMNNRPNFEQMKTEIIKLELLSSVSAAKIISGLTTSLDMKAKTVHEILSSELFQQRDSFTPQMVGYIYQRLLQKKTFEQILAEIMEKEHSFGNEPEKENIKYLEASLEELQRHHPESFNFLKFLSLFPSGLSSSDLDAVCRVTKSFSNWKKLLEKLGVQTLKSETDPMENIPLEVNIIPKNYFIFNITTDNYHGKVTHLKLTTYAQNYFATINHPEHSMLKFRTLSLISLALVDQVRSNFLHSEHLAEYSMVCSHKFWNSSTKILEQLKVFKQKYSLQDQKFNRKVTLFELVHRFQSHEENMRTILEPSFLTALLKEENTRQDVLDLIEGSFLSLLTLNKIFAVDKTPQTGQELLQLLNQIGVEGDQILLTKIKIELLLLFHDRKNSRHSDSSVDTLKRVNELITKLQDQSKKEEAQFETNFAKVYSCYKTKKKNPQSSIKFKEDILKPMAEDLKLLKKADSGSHLIGRMNIIEGKIYALIKQDLPEDRDLIKQLEESLEYFSKHSPSSKRLELKIYSLLAQLQIKRLRKEAGGGPPTLSVLQTQAHELNKIKMKMIKSNYLQFLRKSGDAKYKDKTKKLIKLINSTYQQNFKLMAFFKSSRSITQDFPVVKVPTFFKTDLELFVSEVRQKVRFKFEPLTTTAIQETMKIGCQVMYLDAEIKADKGLAIDSLKGDKPDFMLFRHFCDLLKTKPIINERKGSNSSLGSESQQGMISSLAPTEKMNIEVIILAQQADESFIKGLFAVGITFVISFQMEPCGYNYRKLVIQDCYKEVFTQNFIKALLKGQTICDSYEAARKDVRDFLQSSFQEDYKEIIQDGAVLKKAGPDKKLFSSDKPIELDEKAAPEDISSTRKPSNLHKIFLPFVGREHLILEIFNHFIASDQNAQPIEGQYLQIIGKEGSGKTRLVLEAAYRLHMRNKYEHGIFYFNSRASENLEKSLIETLSYNSSKYDITLEEVLRNLQMLIIIDDLDKKDHPIVKAIQATKKISLIVVPKDEITLEGVKKLEVTPLSDVELSTALKAYTEFEISQADELIEQEANKLIEGASRSIKRLLHALLNKELKICNTILMPVKYYVHYIDLDKWCLWRIQSTKDFNNGAIKQRFHCSRHSRLFETLEIDPKEDEPSPVNTFDNSSEDEIADSRFNKSLIVELDEDNDEPLHISEFGTNSYTSNHEFNEDLRSSGERDDILRPDLKTEEIP